MTVEDWTTNLVKNLQRRGFYTLLPDETSLLNQQEFLKGNEGTLAQDLAGSDVGYTVTYDQDAVHSVQAGFQVCLFWCDLYRQPLQACILPSDHDQVLWLEVY